MQPPTFLRVTCAALLAGTAVVAAAAPQTFALDPTATHAHWELRHFGTSTSRGRFDAVSGSFTLDREAHSGSASITIGTASISTGMRLFDGILRGPLLLATDEHPSAYFVATRAAFDGDRLVSITGEFTLRGISRPLTLRALRFGCRAGTPAIDDGGNEARVVPGEVCGGDFEGEFLRSEFGINHSIPFVGDAVRLVIQVEGARR
jgi:polyisoprenoid-binding protein YceI